MKFSARGFTLVELLIVISIMAITGVVVLASYRSFGEDQRFKNASLDVQSFLRLAQANSTSGLTCALGSTVDWLVQFASQNLELQCIDSSGATAFLKSQPLPDNIYVDSISIGVTSCSSPTTVIFAKLYGKVVASNCVAGSPDVMTIVLRDNQISADCSDITKCKQIKIDPGGQIYEP